MPENSRLKELLAQWAENIRREAQPRAMTVVNTNLYPEDGAILLNPESDQTGGGNAVLPIRYNGEFDLEEGDKVMVTGIGDRLSILGAMATASGDNKLYPRLRSDSLRGPSGELDVYADSGYGLYLFATGVEVKDENGFTVIDLSDAVAGPASATDNAIARFNGTDGKLLQNSGIIIDDNDRLTLPDSGTTPPVNMTERSSAPSSPSAGDIYLDDGTNTDTGNPGLRRYTGAAWEDIGPAAGDEKDVFVATAAQTVADTVTETTLFGSGAGSLTLGADYLTAGKSLRIHMRGQMGDTGTPTINIKLKLGSTVICSTGATALTGVTDVEWMLDLLLTCRSAGASGSVIAGGLFDYDDGSEISLSSGSAVTVDTTGALVLDVTMTWGAADASNTITAQEAIVEAVDPNQIAAGGTTDPAAIHDNVGGEIAAVTEKATPVSGDLLLIEDSADSNNKKRVQVGNLPGGGGGAPTDAKYVVTAANGTLTAEVLSTAIDADVIPDADDTRDLGSSSAAWSELWVKGIAAENHAFPVTNNSGVTVGAGDVGLLQYDATDGYEYVETTTANASGLKCVVTQGGADGATIYVATRGLVTLGYTGTAPNAGMFVVTSTTAGLATGQSYVSPVIFGVAVDAAGFGSATVLLLNNRVRRPLTLSNDILRINATSTFSLSSNGWAGSVNDGAPTSSPVTVSTSTNTIGSITPASSSEHGHIVIRNTTRSNEALVASISGNDITFVDDTPLSTWQNGDALTAVSDTITGAGSARTIDLSQSSSIPELAVEMGVAIVWRDSGASGQDWTLHPYEGWNNSKASFTSSQVANVFIRQAPSVPIINQRFGVANTASGSGTGLGIIRIQYVIVAAP